MSIQTGDSIPACTLKTMGEKGSGVDVSSAETMMALL